MRNPLIGVIIILMILIPICLVETPTQNTECNLEAVNHPIRLRDDRQSINDLAKLESVSATDADSNNLSSAISYCNYYLNSYKNGPITKTTIKMPLGHYSFVLHSFANPVKVTIDICDSDLDIETTKLSVRFLRTKISCSFADVTITGEQWEFLISKYPDLDS